ncbi:MAG: hypothetical protein JKY48_01330, partial [Flavobacteriales bacterium]|nr:hypothetical protein [Flavobacteriales bacterium]
PVTLLETILTNQSRLSDILLVEILHKDPPYTLSMVEAVMLDQPYLSEPVQLQLFNDTLNMNGERIKNILLYQEDYPSTNVLLKLLEEGASAYPDLVLDVLEATEGALASEVMNVVTANQTSFNAQRVGAISFTQNNSTSTLSSCANGIGTQNLHIENVTEYGYYTANYNGVSYSKAYQELFDSQIDSVHLKYEPSWQLYSTKQYSPQYPEAFTEKRHFYYYDLRNRYDRYCSEYHDGIPSIGFRCDEDTDTLWVGSGYTFTVSPFGFNTSLPEFPNPDGLAKSIEHQIRTIPFQEKNISKNGKHKALEQSTYYEFFSRWGDPDKLPYTKVSDIIDDPLLCPPPLPVYVPCSTLIPFTHNVLDVKDYTTWGQGAIRVINYFQYPDHKLYRVIDITPPIESKSYFLFPANCNRTFGPDTTFVVNTDNINPTTSGTGTGVANLTWNLNDAALLSNVSVQIDTVVSNSWDDIIENKHSIYGTNNHLLDFTKQGENLKLDPVSHPNGGFVYPESEKVFYTATYYKPTFPYEHLITAKVLKRNAFTQPILVEDEIGVRSRFIYDDLEEIRVLNTACSQAIVGYDVNYGNKHKPSQSIQYSGLDDSLITSYTYYPDLSLESITDPFGVVQLVEYDEYGRQRAVSRDGQLVNQYSYGFWDGDQNKDFESKAADNFIESTHYPNGTTNAAIVSRKYTDPLGRDFQQISAELPNGVNTSAPIAAEYSGPVVYDAKDRMLEQFKPFGFQDGLNPLALIPRSQSDNLTLYPSVSTTSAYEDTWEARLTRTAKVGQDLLTGKGVDFQYNLMNTFCFSCELSLSNAELDLVMPQGVAGDPYVFSKKWVSDEDNKTSEEYYNAIGQLVATKQELASGSAIVTINGYDSYGNLSTVINPENQRSDYKYNMLGWMYEQTTPDGGVTRYRYNQKGQVSLSQDEKGKQGRLYQTSEIDPLTQLPYPAEIKPYVTLFSYDNLGRFISKGEAYTEPITGFLGSPYGANVVITGSGEFWRLYKFTNKSSYSWAPKGSYVPIGGTTIEGNGGWSWLGNPGGPFYPIDPVCQPCPTIPLVDSVVIDPLKFMSPQFYTTKMSYSIYSQVPYQLTLSTSITSAIGARASANLKGRLNYVYRYNEQMMSNENQSDDDRLVGADFYGYSKYGEIVDLIKQFNPNGMIDENGNPRTPEFKSIQNYSDFSKDGIWSTHDIDADGNGILDFQFHRVIDARGRIKEIYANYANEKATGNKITAYSYDNVFGRLTTKTSFYTESTIDHVTDVTNYTYDLQDRLLKTDGTWLEYDLFYDANQAGYNGHTPVGHQNYNGNINGIKTKYKLSAAGNYSGSLFDEPSVYNYTYDKLNRLTAADAAVGDFLVGTDPTGESYRFGDVTYSFDRIGNFNTLERYTSATGDQQSWSYNYMGYTNKLSSTSGSNGTTNRHYTYDVAGNLSSDDSRGLTNVDYSDENLPLKIHMTETDQSEQVIPVFTEYIYDAGGNRIYKNNDDYEDVVPFPIYDAFYYLRDAEDKTIGVYSVAGGFWDFFAHGNAREAMIRPWSDQQASANTPQGAFPYGQPAGKNHYKINHYSTDHLGNTRVVHEASWNSTTSQVEYKLIGAYDYFPHGKILRKFTNGSGDERYLSVGDERDHETISENNDGTGLDNRGARFYDSDIARFLSLDPRAADLAAWSPYNYVLGNPVMLIDPDGRFPYTFYVRSFAPLGSFKGFGFHDDGRGYSSASNPSSRIEHSFTIDPSAQTYSQNYLRSDQTITDDGRSLTGMPRGGVDPSFSGNGKASFTQEFEGNNPFGWYTPDIEVESSFNLTENAKAGTLSIIGNGSSKRFPATEMLIGDAKGNNLFLGVGAAKGNPANLITALVKEIFNTGITVNIDKEGTFQSVLFKDQEYSISDWNSQFESQDAGPQDR